MRNTITISVPKETAAFIKKETREGSFASTSEFIRHLLRLHNTTKLAHEIKQERAEFLAGKGIELTSWDQFDA